MDAMYEELTDRVVATLSAQAARAPRGMSAAEVIALAAAIAADRDETHAFLIAREQATRACIAAEGEATRKAIMDGGHEVREAITKEIWKNARRCEGADIWSRGGEASSAGSAHAGLDGSDDAGSRRHSQGAFVSHM